MSQPTPPPYQPNQGPQNQQPYQQHQPYAGAQPVQPKKKHTGCIIAAIVAALVFLAIIGSCAALAGGAKKAVDSVAASQSAATNTVHKVTYKATMSGTKKAHVNYSTDGQTSTEDITQDWTKDVDVQGQYKLLSLMTMNSDYTMDNAVTTCEILVDGKSVAKQEGKGSSAMASCNYTLNG